MSMRLWLKLMTAVVFVTAFFAIQGEQVALADGCDLSSSGNGDSDRFFGPEKLSKGTTIRITMTAAPGAGTAIFIVTKQGPVVISVQFTSPHIVSYKMPVDSQVIIGLDWQCNCMPENTYIVHISGCSEAGPPAMNLFDGRINNLQDRDVAAPVAIYEGSIKVYGIDPASGDGWLDVDIAQETIEAVGVPADVPVLLGQGKNHYTGIDIFVYRLPTGEFQLNTHYHDGKPYIFAWNTESQKWHFAW